MGSKPIKSFSKAIFEKFIVNHNPSIPISPFSLLHPILISLIIKLFRSCYGNETPSRWREIGKIQKILRVPREVHLRTEVQNTKGMRPQIHGGCHEVRRRIRQHAVYSGQRRKKPQLG